MAMSKTVSWYKIKSKCTTMWEFQKIGHVEKAKDQANFHEEKFLVEK